MLGGLLLMVVTVVLAIVTLLLKPGLGLANYLIIGGIAWSVRGRGSSRRGILV